MASLHLCTCKANPFQAQNSKTKQSLPSPVSIDQVSFPSSLNPQKYSSSAAAATKLRKLCLKSGPPIRTQIFNHVDASAEPPLTSSNEEPLKIAIIGFGNFGQFIAKGMLRQGHMVLATSRSDYSDYCQKHGIQFYRNVDDLCDEQPDVVFVCSSILSTESVIRGIPMHKLKPDTVFADVLSVKQFPRNLFLEVLPPSFGIVCTHPMFGPESGKNGWASLPFVFDKVRITENSAQEQKCKALLNIFENEGCRMVEMSCEEHDRHAAGSQFITHTIGRILSHLNLDSTPINTKGYQTLLQLTENTVSDSFDLYYGLFMYNVNATEQIENLDRAFETVKQKLFGRLHDILRKQIVERVPVQGGTPVSPPMRKEPSSKPYFLPNNEKMRDLTSFAMPPPPAQEADGGAAASASAAGAGKETRLGGR